MAKIALCLHEMFRFDTIDGGTDLITAMRCCQCREVLHTARIPARLCAWCFRELQACCESPCESRHPTEPWRARTPDDD